MCYVLYLSTDCPDDLTRYSSDLMVLASAREGEDESAQETLLHPYRWFVGSKSGCSCTFRYAMDPSIGFGPPVEWSPEEGNEIEATGRFYRLVTELVSAGHAVDCVNLWMGDGQEVHERTVDLSTVGEADFRFYEGHHVRFARTEAI